MNATWKGALIGAAGMLLALVLIALLVILTGGYNVAATDRHNPMAGWALDTTFRNSVQRQADEVAAPPQFTAAMITTGAGKYKAMCEHCHGGVGAGRAEWAKTMRPHPPALAEVADEWTPQEVFWLVQHGVKMTAMPAFGPTHDDAELWNVVAFVKALPTMTAAEYAAFPSNRGSGGDAGHAHASERNRVRQN